jgi:hypothetical protein
MILTAGYLPALMLLAVGCASVPRPQQPAISVPEDIQRALDSAVASVDTLTVPKYYSGPTCPMPVQRGDQSGDTSMVLHHPTLDRRDTTSTDKDPRCYNPLFRQQRGAV